MRTGMFNLIIIDTTTPEILYIIYQKTPPGGKLTELHVNQSPDKNDRLLLTILGPRDKLFVFFL